MAHGALTPETLLESVADGNKEKARICRSRRREGLCPLFPRHTKNSGQSARSCVKSVAPGTDETAGEDFVHRPDRIDLHKFVEELLSVRNLRVERMVGGIRCLRFSGATAWNTNSRFERKHSNLHERKAMPVRQPENCRFRLACRVTLPSMTNKVQAPPSENTHIRPR